MKILIRHIYTAFCHASISNLNIPLSKLFSNILNSYYFFPLRDQLAYIYKTDKIAVFCYLDLSIFP
jgi:hypothetical protein